MRRLATVLLKHQTTGGSHYDWMLDYPGPEAAHPGLWTARVHIPSRCWTLVRPWSLELLAPHRRAYLTYQGPLTEGRGSVLRTDQGLFLPRLWTAQRIILDLEMNQCRGRILLRHIDGPRWQACLFRMAAENFQEDC